MRAVHRFNLGASLHCPTIRACPPFRLHEGLAELTDPPEWPFSGIPFKRGKSLDGIGTVFESGLTAQITYPALILVLGS